MYGQLIRRRHLDKTDKRLEKFKSRDVLKRTFDYWGFRGQSDLRSWKRHRKFQYRFKKGSNEGSGDGGSEVE